MKEELIIISEYCLKSDIDPSFVLLLEREGLLEVCVVDGVKCIESAQVPEIERYSRMYYDLSINIEGIDVIHNLLKKIELLEDKISLLQKRLGLFDSDIWDDDIESL